MSNNKQAAAASPKKQSAIASALISVIGGSFLTRNYVIRLLPFLLYLMVLGVIYIANTYYAEKKVIESDRLTRELKELRYEYITTRSELMQYGRQSEIAVKLRETGVQESKTPPAKIKIGNNINKGE